MTAEPRITVNGTPLSEAQAMTLRVALQSFLSEVATEGLGDDETGRAIARGYLARGGEINELLKGA
jgi:hypothetical protein